MGRTLAITGRLSLADVSEDWDDQCYVVFRKSTVGELLELKETDTEKLDDTAALAQIIEACKSHFVKGKLKVLDGDKVELLDMEAGDIDSLPVPTLYNLFADITGAQIGPKGTPPAPTPTPAQPSDANSTETPSSTA